MVCERVQTRARAPNVKGARLLVRMSSVVDELRPIERQRSRWRLEESNGKLWNQILQVSLAHTRKRLVRRERDG